MSTAERGAVQFGHTRIAYDLRRSDRRKTVSVLVEGGEVQVVAPTTTPLETLQDIVQRRAAWIIDKQDQHAALTAAPPSARQFIGGEEVRYLGRQYRLRLVAAQATPRLVGGHLEVPAGPPQEVREALVAWYRRQAARRFPERVTRYARQLGQDVPAVLIREQAKRWGSCDAGGHLRLNWRLMQAPLPLIDLVVAHELVHREQPHHGPLFWRRLTQVLPDHHERQAQLDQWGDRLFW